jgi:hypothetical protein
LNTSTGTGTTSQITTGDHRILYFQLKEGITSGTYTYPDPTDNGLLQVTYGEMINSGGTHYLQNLPISEATLELEVSPDGRHLRSPRFHIVAKTHKEVILNIEADFDIYLAIE